MMKRFYTAIVRRRRLVLAVFALAAVLSMAATSRVQVDYDINDYLPPESPSTTAIKVMNGAFTGGIPNMRVMVRDVTVPQALEYKEKLAAIDGVSSVAWLDDSLDVTVPLQMQDTATVESYYKDGCALFTVTVEDEKRLEAVAAVRDLIGEGNALEGAAVSTAVATNSTVTEVEQHAVDDLGMVKMDNSQIEYVELTRPDVVTVAHSEHSLENVVSGLTEWFSSIVEYIR